MVEDNESRYEIYDLRRRVEVLERKVNLLRHPPSEITENQARTPDIRSQLLGRLTMILLTDRYFKSNQDLAMFAKNELGIPLVGWEKKSRPEIIGITLQKLSQLDSNRIRRFYNAVSAFQNRERRGKIDNFFQAWDKTISGLEFRR